MGKSKRPFQFRLLTFLLAIPLLAAGLGFGGPVVWRLLSQNDYYLLMVIVFSSFLWLPMLVVAWLAVSTFISGSRSTRKDRMPDQLDFDTPADEDKKSDLPRKKPRRKRRPPWFQPPLIGPRGYR